MGHLATQENAYWVLWAQGTRLAPGLRELVGHGQPASTPSWDEMWEAWREITNAADKYLDTLTEAQLRTHLEWKGKLLQMAVANGRYFGKAICIAPDAKLTDGQLQVAIFGDLSIWDYLKNLSKLKKGVKINRPQVSYYDAKEVLLESNDSCGIEADGEYVGLAPATISILPKAIAFLMPPNFQ